MCSVLSAASPAKLSLAQAAEAELAKVAQDHASAASGAMASQTAPGVSNASDRSKRQDDRYTFGLVTQQHGHEYAVLYIKIPAW